MDVHDLLNPELDKPWAFDSVMKGQKVVATGADWVKVEFTVEPRHLNNRDSTHGGFLATVIDGVSTLACLLARPEDRSSVSVDLAVSFYGSAVEGDVLVV